MEIAPSVSRAIKAGDWFKTIRTERSIIRIQKRAFLLFESLLSKIKTDLIKFLLNLNIVVSSEEREKIKRNYPREKNRKKSR